MPSASHAGAKRTIPGTRFFRGEIRENHGSSDGSRPGSMMRRSKVSASPVQCKRPAVRRAPLSWPLTGSMVMRTISCSLNCNGSTGLNTPPAYMASTVIGITCLPLGSKAPLQHYTRAVRVAFLSFRPRQKKRYHQFTQSLNKRRFGLRRFSAAFSLESTSAVVSLE